MKFVYNSAEFNKMLIETINDNGNITIYTWIARYATPPYENKWYSSEEDKAKTIWMIRREQYDSETWVYDYSYPNLDTWFNYAWSERANYNYDEKTTPPVPPIPTGSSDILLENWDKLITEIWEYIILEIA